MFSDFLWAQVVPEITSATVREPSSVSNFWMSVYEWSHWDKVLPIMVILSIGYPLVTVLSRALGRIASQHLTDHHGLIVTKFSRYLGYLILLVTLLHNLGLQLTAVLGAAGVGAVAA